MRTDGCRRGGRRGSRGAGPAAGRSPRARRRRSGCRRSGRPRRSRPCSRSRNGGDTSGHDDRVRHEVEVPLDEVAAHAREPVQRPHRRRVASRRRARSQVGEEPWPGVLAGTEEHRVGVAGRLLRQRGGVQAPHGHVRAAAAVVVGELVGAAGGGDVGLDHHEVRGVVQVQALHVLVLDRHLDVVGEVARQRRQAERREQRVLDRSEERARGFRERGQHHLHPHEDSLSPLGRSVKADAQTMWTRHLPCRAGRGSVPCCRGEIRAPKPACRW